MNQAGSTTATSEGLPAPEVMQGSRHLVGGDTRSILNLTSAAVHQAKLRASGGPTGERPPEAELAEAGFGQINTQRVHIDLEKCSYFMMLGPM